MGWLSGPYADPGDRPPDYDRLSRWSLKVGVVTLPLLVAAVVAVAVLPPLFPAVSGVVIFGAFAVWSAALSGTVDDWGDDYRADAWLARRHALVTGACVLVAAAVGFALR